jgi:hypothetical protein
MLVVYRAGAVLLFLITFISVTHDTAILDYLFKVQPDAKPTAPTPRNAVPKPDRFQQFP